MHLRLRGLPRRSAQSLVGTVRQVHDDAVEARRIANNLAIFDGQLVAVVNWLADFDAAARNQLAIGGWLTHEFVARWEAKRPAPHPNLPCDHPEFDPRRKTQPATATVAIGRWKTGVKHLVSLLNEDFL